MSFIFQSSELNATNIINRIGHYNTKEYKFKVGKSYWMCEYVDGRRMPHPKRVTCIKRTRCFVTFREDIGASHKLIKRKIKKRKNTDFLENEICEWMAVYWCTCQMQISALN
tara:strand:- start:1735 stop:2070 length:336 start_codon:yes stop_codon:yes gene_type:complete